MLSRNLYNRYLVFWQVIEIFVNVVKKVNCKFAVLEEEYDKVIKFMFLEWYV